MRRLRCTVIPASALLLAARAFAGQYVLTVIGQPDRTERTAGENTWLKDHDCRNVFVDLDNEGMAHQATRGSISQMIDAAHAVRTACSAG